MHCEDIAALLPLVADASLPGSLGASVKQHLAGCASCRLELSSLQLVVSTLRKAPAVPATEPLAIAFAAERQRASRRTFLAASIVAATILIGVITATTVGIEISVGSHTLAVGPAWRGHATRIDGASVSRELARLSARLDQQAEIHQQDLWQLARTIDDVRSMDRVQLDASETAFDAPLAEFAAQILVREPTVQVPDIVQTLGMRPLKKSH